MKKSLINNALFNVLYRMLNVFFPLITSMYVSRVLLSSGIGKVAYAQNIVQYFIIFASLGIPTYGAREIAKVRDSKSAYSKVFWELFVINGLATLGCILAYYTFVFVSPMFNATRTLNCVVGIVLTLNFFNIDWFYQGQEEYKYIALRSCIIKIVSLCSIFAFVKTQSDFIVYAAIQSLATAGNYVFNFIHLKRYINRPVANFDFKRHMKPVLILLSSTIAVELYTLLDTTMLGYLCTDSIVGYYTNSVKLVKMITTFISAISAVLLPRLSYYYGNGEKKLFDQVISTSTKMMIWITIPCSIGLFFVSDSVITLFFGQDFAPAISITKILCILIFAISLNNLFGTQILVTVGKEKLLLVSVMAGAITNLILNSILIPRIQANGAALASAASEVVVLLFTFVFALKNVKFAFDRPFFTSLLFSACGMTFLLIVGNHIMCKIGVSDLINTVFMVLIGIISYVAIGFCTHNCVLQQMISILKRKVVKK